MNIENGRPNPESQEEILELMVDDAKDLFGEDLNDNETSTIRYLYSPVAQRLAEAQNDIGLVLSSTQIDFAQDESLDLLTSLIGVTREPARRADGEVTFYRNEPSDTRDYTIPSGTYVRTDGEDAITFETTESAILEQGTTEVNVPVEAVNSGSNSNVGSNTVTVIVNRPTGIDGVINNEIIGGGTDRENDNSLRERAKEELGEGARATASALVSSCRSADPDVRSVTIYTTPEDNLGEDPGFELVVEGGDSDLIAQSIRNNKAAGDRSYAGVNGQAITEPVDTELTNGQVKPLSFSRPIPIDIYVDMELETEDTFEGIDAVKDSIVQYIGGTNSEDISLSGNLNLSDDVIAGEIKYAIRDIAGVYDIPTLNIGTTENPEGISNIPIDDGEVATTKAEFITVQEL